MKIENFSIKHMKSFDLKEYSDRLSTYNIIYKLIKDYLLEKVPELSEDKISRIANKTAVRNTNRVFTNQGNLRVLTILVHDNLEVTAGVLIASKELTENVSGVKEYTMPNIYPERYVSVEDVEENFVKDLAKLSNLPAGILESKNQPYHMDMISSQEVAEYYANIPLMPLADKPLSFLNKVKLFFSKFVPKGEPKVITHRHWTSSLPKSICDPETVRNATRTEVMLVDIIPDIAIEEKIPITISKISRVTYPTYFKEGNFRIIIMSTDGIILTISADAYEKESDVDLAIELIKNRMVRLKEKQNEKEE